MKFNVLEKKAVILTTLVIFIFTVSLVTIGNRNLWFESKNEYRTIINNADGLSSGSNVTFGGLYVGNVQGLKVNDDNMIEVTFTVTRSLADKIREDSLARMVRTMAIGEMRIEIQPGSKESAILKPGSIIQGRDSLEITDLISGKNIGQFMDKFGALSEGLAKWSEMMAVLTQKMNPEDLAKTYDLLLPTMQNVSKLAAELHVFTQVLTAMKNDLMDNKLAKKTLSNIEKITHPMAKHRDHIEGLLVNVHTLSTSLAKNPNMTQDMANVLKEMVITLKAMQKSFFLESHVEKVKEGK